MIIDVCNMLIQMSNFTGLMETIIVPLAGKSIPQVSIIAKTRWKNVVFVHNKNQDLYNFMSFFVAFQLIYLICEEIHAYLH